MDASNLTEPTTNGNIQIIEWIKTAKARMGKVSQVSRNYWLFIINVTVTVLHPAKYC